MPTKIRNLMPGSDFKMEGSSHQWHVTAWHEQFDNANDIEIYHNGFEDIQMISKDMMVEEILNNDSTLDNGYNEW